MSIGDSLQEFILIDGIRKPFSMVFEKYYRPLILFTNRYVSSLHDCEDLVQDLMVQVVVAGTSFDSDYNLRNYLYRSVRNRALNYIRSGNVRSKYIAQVDNEDVADNFFDNIVQAEVHTLLYRFVEELPDKCKEVIRLNILEGLSYKETAELLNISVNTVKTQRARGLKILKKKMPSYIWIIVLALLH